MESLKEEAPRTGGLGLLGGLPGDLKEIEHEFNILTSLEEQERACSTKISKLWASIQDIARDTIPIPTTLVESEYPKVESSVLVSDGTVVLTRDGEPFSVRLQDFPPHIVEELVRLGAALLLSHLRAKVRETSDELSAMEKAFGEELLTKDYTSERRITVKNAKTTDIYAVEPVEPVEPVELQESNGASEPGDKQTGVREVQKDVCQVGVNLRRRYSFKGSFGAAEIETEDKVVAPDIPKIDIEKAVNAVALY